MPPAVIVTTEFDYCRKMAEQMGCIYAKHRKLLEFFCVPGTFHGSYADFSLQRSDLWF